MENNGRCQQSPDTGALNAVSSRLFATVDTLQEAGISTGASDALREVRGMFEEIASRTTEPEHIADTASRYAAWTTAVLECVDNPSSAPQLAKVSEQLDAFETNSSLMLFRQMGIEACYAVGRFDTAGASVLRILQTSAHHGGKVVATHLVHVTRTLLTPEVRATLSEAAMQQLREAMEHLEPEVLRTHVLNRMASQA